MNYYISDLHLFHKNVTDEGKNFDHRPFKTLDEMHQTIKERWNTKITGTDHVYILGDMCWKEDERAISFVANLKGNKHLILGNHDRIKDHRFRQLFSEITPYKELDDQINNKHYNLVLSHFPIAFWNLQHHYDDGNERGRWSIHLYGHVHASKEEDLYQNFIKHVNEKTDIGCEAYNVGCMMPYMDYMPRSLDEIRKASNNKNGGGC